MPQQLQDVFNRLQKSKDEKKEIKAAYRDALDNSQEYHKITEEIKALKERKKNIENSVRSDFGKDMDRLESLKIDIETDKVLISDISISQLINGRSVEVSDEHENKYEPVFSVRFKKLG